MRQPSETNTETMSPAESLEALKELASEADSGIATCPLTRKQAREALGTNSDRAEARNAT